MGELVRLETEKDATDVQAVLDGLSERQIPVIEMVESTPVILSTSLSAAEQALVLLYHSEGAVDSLTLRKWVGYGNTTRWRDKVIRQLRSERKIHVDEGDRVHLLMPGRVKAEKIILAAV